MSKPIWATDNPLMIAAAYFCAGLCAAEPSLVNGILMIFLLISGAACTMLLIKEVQEYSINYGKINE